MGNRANIAVKQRDGGYIYIYVHWDGDELAARLRDALKRGRERWSDGPYLCRIIFCEVVRDDVLGDTGVGLSTHLTDNQVGRPLLVVDCESQTVGACGVIAAGEPLRAASFADFARLSDDEAYRFHHGYGRGD